MEEQKYVLITGGAEVPTSLDTALEAALPVRRCPGPSEVYCPAEHQESCPLRHGAKAAVVFLAGEHELFSLGRWECAAAAGSPAVIVLGGSTQPPRGDSNFMIVGDATGRAGVLEALAAVFDQPNPPYE